MITGITGHPPGKYEAMETLLTGSYSINFWGGEVLLGMIFPLLIILGTKGRSMNALFVAAFAGMVGIFFMRYDLVIVGQLVPHFHGMGLVDYPELYTYMPSLHENLIVLGGVAFCGLAFLVGEKMFRGHVSEDH
jgi:molybdopterin-containing oxidoreductase family membrane subunit